MKAFLVAIALLLTACGDYTIDKRDDVPAKIVELSFKGAHYVEHCSKGCRYDFIPDRWFLKVCNDRDAQACRVFRIEHAPWDWQYKGAEVVANWTHSRDGGWQIDGITQR